jgi:anti-sigma B factor antagonist
MDDDASLTVSSERLDNTVIVRVAGEVDMSTVYRLDSALAEAEASVAAPNPLVADLTEVTFLGQMGLSALLVAHQRCRRRRIPLVVVASHPQVLRPLRVTALDQVLIVVESLTEATNSGIA